MKKKKSYFILCIIMVLFLTGCDLHSPSNNLVVCGSYGVPGMYCWELKGGTYNCETLETDSYGRIMFSYTTDSCITEKEETAIVICQVSDSKYAYYYEDLCYLLGEVSEDAIAEFKERNDWECELDYTKMTKRENEVSYDLFLITRDTLDYEDIEERMCEEFKVEEDNIKVASFLDISPIGQELFWIKIEKDDTLHKYYMIVNTDYELCYVEVEDEEGEIDFSSLVSFKQENGWAYE